MSDQWQPDSIERLEQIISTIFACRNVIKYNSSLNSEQKGELIADIDICLRSLRTGFTGDTTTPKTQPQFQFQQVGRIMPLAMPEKVQNSTDTHAALQELYRVYHTYIDTKQSNNIGTFVVRFDSVVASLIEVQNTLEKCQDVSVVPVESPLHRIRTFIADLYYMFMELVRTISHVLEGSNVHVDTEKLSSPPQRELTKTEIVEQQIYSLPLSNAFLEHQQLNEVKGSLFKRVNDSRAFLFFLRESLDADFYKRDEIVTHLNGVVLLLEDLASVLSGYEDAVGLLFRNR